MFLCVRMTGRPDPQSPARAVRPAWVLAVLLLLAACALPRNTALSDWAQAASLAAEAAEMQQDGPRAMQQALSIYLYALGIRGGPGDLTFRPAAFAAFAVRAAAADAAAGRAVADLGAALAANDGPQPYFDVSRLAATLRGADAPVQVLVATLGRASAAPPRPVVPPDPAAADPAVRRALQDQALAVREQAAAEAAVRDQQAEVLRRIGEGHAMIAAQAGIITQRGTERRIMAELDGLRRAVSLLPPGHATTPGALAAVLAP